jgi:hypothetical protein
MRDYFPNGIERLVLLDKMQSELGLSYSAAQVKISRALKAGLLRSENKVLMLP